MFQKVALEPANLAPLFDPGEVIVTVGAAETMKAHRCDQRDLLARHVHGVWNVSGWNAEVNRRAIKNGGTIQACYDIGNGTLIWVITDEHKEHTNFMLSEELRTEIQAKHDSIHRSLDDLFKPTAISPIRA